MMLTPEQENLVNHPTTPENLRLVIEELQASEKQLFDACRNYVQWYDTPEMDLHSHDLYMDPLRVAIAQAKGTS